MFERTIWDKLPDCIFESLEIAIPKFSKITRVIYPKHYPSQTWNYWLNTPNQQTLCIEANIFEQRAINYKSASGHLQNNTVNGEMSITINHDIMAVIQVQTQQIKHTFKNMFAQLSSKNHDVVSGTLSKVQFLVLNKTVGNKSSLSMLASYLQGLSCETRKTKVFKRLTYLLFV